MTPARWAAATASTRCRTARSAGAPPGPNRCPRALPRTYARELADTNILINAACPGLVATDLNGFRGTGTPQQGAATPIRLATLPDDGPTGGFFNGAGTVPW